MQPGLSMTLKNAILSRQSDICIHEAASPVFENTGALQPIPVVSNVRSRLSSQLTPSGILLGL